MAQINFPSIKNQDSKAPKNPKDRFVRMIINLETWEIGRMLAESYPQFKPVWEIQSCNRVVFVPYELWKDKEFRSSLAILAQLFESELKSMKVPDATELLLGKKMAEEAKEFQNFII